MLLVGPANNSCTLPRTVRVDFVVSDGYHDSFLGIDVTSPPGGTVAPPVVLPDAGFLLAGGPSLVISAVPVDGGI